MSSPGGSGSPINSVIEAEIRAGQFGRVKQPDAAEDAAERKAARAGWLISGLVVVGATWFVAGTVPGVIALGALAVIVLVTWWIQSRLAKAEDLPAEEND